MHRILLTKHDYDQSFNIIKKLIEDNPNDFENNYLLEMFYIKIGMPHDAIKYATRAIELNPLFSDVYHDRAVSYRTIGDKENSIHDLRLCLSLQPEAIACKVCFAYHLLWINDLQNADRHIAELEQRINPEKSPQTTIPRFYDNVKFPRALYFAKLGRKDQALSIAENAGVYAELGMAHEAVQSLQEYIKTDKYSVSYEALSGAPHYERIRNDPEFLLCNCYTLKKHFPMLYHLLKEHPVNLIKEPAPPVVRP